MKTGRRYPREFWERAVRLVGDQASERKSQFEMMKNVSSLGQNSAAP